MLRPRLCPNATCGCHIGYVHRPELEMDRIFGAGLLERIPAGMAGNPDDAEDWAQDCFVRVFRQLGTYNPDMPFTPWLMRVVSNTCINLAKARAGRRSRIEFSLDANEEETMASHAPDPLDVTLNREEERRVRKAVDSLPPQHPDQIERERRLLDAVARTQPEPPRQTSR